MKFSHLYRLSLWVLSLWFFIGQTFSVAHATSYGEKLHDHEGIPCAVSILQDEECASLPLTQASGFEVVTFKDVYVISFSSVLTSHSEARAPPPRAPPFNQ